MSGADTAVLQVTDLRVGIGRPPGRQDTTVAPISSTPATSSATTTS